MDPDNPECSEESAYLAEPESKYGWEPDTPLRDGLSKTYSWMFKQVGQKKKDNFQLTSHNIGRKKVFVLNKGTNSCLTQVAYGELEPGEIIEPHKHQTMGEYFYFIEGSAHYVINGENHDISPGSFLKIPSNIVHSLVCNGVGILKFFYFGIAVDL